MRGGFSVNCLRTGEAEQASSVGRRKLSELEREGATVINVN